MPGFLWQANEPAASGKSSSLIDELALHSSDQWVFSACLIAREKSASIVLALACSVMRLRWRKILTGTSASMAPTRCRYSGR